MYNFPIIALQNDLDFANITKAECEKNWKYTNVRISERKRKKYWSKAFDVYITTRHLGFSSKYVKRLLLRFSRMN